MGDNDDAQRYEVANALLPESGETILLTAIFGNHNTL